MPAETIAFESAEQAQMFRVDTEKRTISGLAAPWNVVASNGFARWRFEKGSLRWEDPGRVKLNLHHDREQAIGRAVRLQSTAQGLDVTFRIARGEEGDRALSLAEDGVLDGMSVELDFDSPSGDRWTEGSDGVRVVQSAWLRSVGLVSVPAFDGARVSAVVAHKTNERESQMAADKNDNEQEREPLSQAQFAQVIERVMDANEEKFQAVIGESREQFAASLKEIAGQLSTDHAAAIETLFERLEGGPGQVSASRFNGRREQPIYPFSGRRGSPSIIRDMYYAHVDREPEAMERLRQFSAQTAKWANAPAEAGIINRQFAAMSTQHFGWKFDANTSNASEIIPPGYRPDLYVDELTRGRPLVNGASPGEISNAAPFTVPVLVSKSGAAALHVEGTNPSTGSLTFGAKTVTPVAVSGKYIITRELIDAGNPAIDQIAFNAMREEYAAQTEAIMWDMLNGTDGVGGVITNGRVPSGAQAATSSGDGLDLLLAIRGALADYPFVRFAAPDRAYLSQEATRALAVAVGSDDRPLLPSVGAVNTAGIGNAVTQGWYVDGLAHVPAWAMTDNEAGDADVVTFRSSDVWKFESGVLNFRFEEKGGPANIELAIFGYFAAHVLRPSGLSGIRHTLGS